MSNSLKITDVSVAYNNIPAIEDITLEIKAGEIFGLMGLNGAGKTSLIKCILALRNQDKGTISIFGSDREAKESKSKLAYLPEKFEPPWFLSGMEFLKFSLSLYNQKMDDAQIIEAAQSLALDTAALKRKVQTYSKGMRQKLGILGTVLTGCPLFILDEPMSGLDPLARSLVKKMLLDVKNKERTIFLSSHILADMDEICDRVALLHQGKIRFVGTPAELKKKHPQQILSKLSLILLSKTKQHDTICTIVMILFLFGVLLIFYR